MLAFLSAVPEALNKALYTVLVTMAGNTGFAISFCLKFTFFYHALYFIIRITIENLFINNNKQLEGLEGGHGIQLGFDFYCYFHQIVANWQIVN